MILKKSHLAFVIAFVLLSFISVRYAYRAVKVWLDNKVAQKVEERMDRDERFGGLQYALYRQSQWSVQVLKKLNPDLFEEEIKFLTITPTPHLVIQRREDGFAEAVVEVHSKKSVKQLQCTIDRLKYKDELQSVAPSWDCSKKRSFRLQTGAYHLNIITGSGSKKITSPFFVGDLYLVAGQSNGTSPAQNVPPAYSNSGRAIVGSWEMPEKAPPHFEVPTVLRPVLWGWSWVWLADRLSDEESGVPVGFFIVARSATASTEWRWPEGRHGKLYRNALDLFNYKAVLWVQGEYDVQLKLTQEESYKNLKSLIEMSKQLKPDLPFYVALNSLVGITDAPVRKAQKQLIDEGIARLGPDTDTIRKNRSWLDAEGAEFVGLGLEQHANLWHEVLNRDFPKNKE